MTRADADIEPDDGPPFDPDRLVETLARHDVDYLLVGGMGARLHGATRLTKDLDCLPRFDEHNTMRLAGAMRELHARLRVNGLSDAESVKLTSHLPSPEFFRRDQISNWMTDAGPLDVLQDMPDRSGQRLVYEQLVDRATAHQYAGGITVVVAGLDDIVASKEYADRDKDHEALPELYRLLGRDDKPDSTA
ncbi:hypothetical protein [Desertimonas flava]|uniref:hypothetical protein n=1 Tax=Desertimonas flava TaxID=2064846 RepID=UPI000E341048|nr:hypothetical protein [Desertimonas flava]